MSGSRQPRSATVVRYRAAVALAIAALTVWFFTGGMTFGQSSGFTVPTDDPGREDGGRLGVAYSEGQYSGAVGMMGPVFVGSLDSGIKRWAEYKPEKQVKNPLYNNGAAPNQAEFLAVQQMPKVIGPAQDDRENAVVVSASEIVGGMQAWSNLKSADGGTGAAGEWLTPGQYQSRYNSYYVENHPPPGPTLSATTMLVLLGQPPGPRGESLNVLREFPFDPRMPTDRVLPGFKTALVCTQPGCYGKVVLTSEFQLAYDSDYMVRTPPDRSPPDGMLGGCDKSPLRNLGLGDGTFANDVYDLKWRFEACSPAFIDWLTHPVVGARVDSATRWMLSNAAIYTDPKGTYVMPYYFPAGSQFVDTVFLEIRYNGLDPRIVYGGVYIASRAQVAGGGPTPSVNAPGATVAALGPVPSFSYGVDPNLIGATPLYRTARTTNFAVDTGYLLVSTEMRSEDRSDPSNGDSNSVRVAIREAEGDPNLPDTPVPPPIYTYADPHPLLTDIARTQDAGAGSDTVVRTEADFHDRGLLKSISRKDLANTDLYLYSTDDHLVLERHGLNNNEWAGKGKVSDAPPGSDAGPTLGALQMGMGKDALGHDVQVLFTGALLDGEQFAASANIQTFVPIRGAVDRLHVVVVNRSTGYIGAGWAFLNAHAAVPFFHAPTITMRPPNLKVHAVRAREDSNDTAGDSPMSGARVAGLFTIGFEGSGLTTDQWIKLSTEWYDVDGSPLPPIPGFTGRVALSVDYKTIKATGTFGVKDDAKESTDQQDVSLFEINPGTNVVGLRLPASEPPAHLYVHVSGETKARQPNFGTETIGADGPLGYRPTRYVPFQVAIYDDAATLATRLAGGNGAQPVYRWFYRPEMQFSIFELAEIELRDQGGHTVDLRASGTGASSFGQLVGDVDLAYTLVQDPNTTAPDPFGPDRQLVFGMPGHEVLAHVGGPRTTRLVDASQAAQLGPADLAALRLYQENDRGNVLFEVGKTAPIRIKLVDPRTGNSRTAIGCGETLQAIAKAQKRKDGTYPSIVWSFRHPAGSENVRANLRRDSADTKSAWFSVDRDSPVGWVYVRASDAQMPTTFREARVRVGCSGTLNAPGEAEFSNHGPDVTISLGQRPGGTSAGYLTVRGDAPSAELVSAKSVELTDLLDNSDDEDKVVRDATGELSQALANTSFTEVSPNKDNDKGFTVDTYDSSALKSTTSTGTDGKYALNDGVKPRDSWSIEGHGADGDPDAGAAAASRRLVFTHTQDGLSIDTKEYLYSAQTNSWKLTEGAAGNGVRVETTTTTIANSSNPDAKTEDRVVEDETGHRATSVHRTHAPYPWGEEVTEEKVDTFTPLGSLVTNHYFYERSTDLGFGKPKRDELPGGVVVAYTYDDQGRKTSTQTSLGADMRAVRYEYEPLQGDSKLAEDFDHPRTVTETLGAVTVAKTFYVYSASAGGERTEVVEIAASPGSAYGAPGNRSTETRYNPRTSNSLTSGKVRRIRSFDGHSTEFDYAAGTCQALSPMWVGPSVDRPGSPPCLQTKTTSMVDGRPIEGKTTRVIKVEDPMKRIVYEQTDAFVNGGFEKVSWVQRTYDDRGHLTGESYSDGTSRSARWDCCMVTWERDRNGVETTYEPDALHRVKRSIIKRRLVELGDLVTDYEYDAEGRPTSESMTSPAGRLSRSRHYDGVGRILDERDTGGLLTTYSYDPSGRTTTILYPDGGMEVRERYFDGRVKSITGTAVVAQFYDYVVNPDGSLATTVRRGAPTSAQYTTTTTNMFGEVRSVEQPGFGGGSVEIETSYFNAKGQRWKTTHTGLPSTLFEYDEVGRVFRSGMDVDGSDALGTSGSDRIREVQTLNVFDAGAVWQTTVRRVYATSGGSPTTVSTEKVRLSGLTLAKLEETQTTDPFGNATSRKVALDPNGQTRTETVHTPASTIDQVTTFANGTLASTQTSTGLSYSYKVDGFGRRKVSHDPRTGDAVLEYDGAGLLRRRTAADGSVTAFDYDNAGRLNKTTNANGKTSHQVQNVRGQVTNEDGDVPYPVEREFDPATGRLSRLHTFRTAAQPDTTQYFYDPGTGLLDHKTDAKAHTVQFTYGPGGRIKTRVWSRSGQGGRITATYDYLPNTGDLHSITYSDGTPTVTFTYDRLGRPETVTDAVGTRAFGYNAAQQLESETVIGAGGYTLTNTFEGNEPNAVRGRSNGVKWGDAYAVTYGFDDRGRVGNVQWKVDGDQDVATYSYASNAPMLSGMTTSRGLVVTYGYDAKRDLRTEVTNRSKGLLISKYESEYDLLGRRQNAVRQGSAYPEGASFAKYDYDDRNELVGAHSFAGADSTNASQAIPGRDREYAYDTIGNRKTSTEVSVVASYSSNALNQYDSLGIGEATKAFEYDDDGNVKAFSDAAGGTAYAYDGENRLIAVTPKEPAAGATKAEFTYDYLGRRARKKVSEYFGGWQVKSTTNYVNSGTLVIGEVTTLADGTTTTKRHVWGLDIGGSVGGAGGIGGLLATVSNGAAQYYAFDGVGNVAQVVRAADGTVGGRYEYDPYGKATLVDGAMAEANSFRYATKPFDVETGLSDFGGRNYSADWGRWINRDPLGEAGGINVYGYVLNGPPNVIDPDGRTPLQAAGALIGGIGAGLHYAFTAPTSQSWGSFAGNAFVHIGVGAASGALWTVRAVQVAGGVVGLGMLATTPNHEPENQARLVEGGLLVVGGLHGVSSIPSTRIQTDSKLLTLKETECENELTQRVEAERLWQAEQETTAAAAATPRGFVNHPTLGRGLLQRTGERSIHNQGQHPSCGPTTCEMIADDLVPGRVATSIDGPAGRVAALTKDGTTFGNLERLLDANGIASNGTAGHSVESLAEATQRGNPAIAMIRTGVGGHSNHFVIVDGVTTRFGEQVVAIRNPWGVQYFQTIEEFKAVFTGWALPTKGLK